MKRIAVATSIAGFLVALPGLAWAQVPEPAAEAIEEMCQDVLRDLYDVTVRFVDNGDGTVTDNATGLMWEKKSTDTGIQGVSVPFAWFNRFSSALDSVTFLQVLNNCITPSSVASESGGLAGYCDWRLPQTRELLSILDCDQGDPGDPCIDPVFGPTATSWYWAGTSDSSNQNNAWRVHFGDGSVDSSAKTSTTGSPRLRAVRSIGRLE